MAYTYPLSLASLADLFQIEEVVWDVQRNDELSGTGDARVWQAELADPLWRGDVKLIPAYHDQVKQIAARIRKLYGAQESFLLYDPLSQYPQADPDGSLLGSSTVIVASVGENNKSLSLSGLPAGYVLTIGDKAQIAYGSDPVRNFFFEVSETVTADGEGATAEFEIFPHVPPGVAADDEVVLIKPACRGFIMPGTFNPGTARGMITTGAGFTFMERRR